MDVVYVVRQGNYNPELQHSLATLANLPHERVWIVGYRPSWVDGSVSCLATTQYGTKYANSTGNVRAACTDDRISDPFVLMNDDFYVLRPIERVPTLHRGTVDEVAADYRSRAPGSPYLAGMRETQAALAARGFDPDELLSYELHVPLVVHKDPMIRALDAGRDHGIWHKRTAYGAFAHLAGQRADDVKIHDRVTLPPADAVFLSTSDDSFRRGAVGQWIRDHYPV